LTETPYDRVADVVLCEKVGAALAAITAAVLGSG
jgi:hypothetical protein